MPLVTVHATSPLPETFRTAKVRGVFDIPPSTETSFHLAIDLPDLTSPSSPGSPGSFDWSVGAIVGASGRGKTLLARQVFGPAYTYPPTWSAPALVDDFSKDLSVQDVTGALTAVGLSSAPVWLRPYHVLSVGQQHRADLARALLEGGPLVVYDEFTSTVDRTVAAALSTAVSKWARRKGQRFVAVSCHKDILAWLEADWVIDLDEGSFSKECQRRPPIALEVREGSRAAWPRFRGHHYLSADLSPAARVFLAYVSSPAWPEERLVGFFSILPAMGMTGWRRGHRTVVLPDWQGMGIGNAMIEATAEALWRKEGLRFRATTSAPALVNHRRRHPEMWRLVQAPSMHDAYSDPSHKLGTGRGRGRRQPLRGKGQDLGRPGRARSTAAATDRLTTSWEYIPEALRASYQAHSTPGPG